MRMKEINRQFSRTEMLIGSEGMEKLKKASVIVFGVGGVGSYVTEGLARAGVGALTLVDNDVIDITNINRQLPALHSTLGRSKAEVMAQRVMDINPLCRAEAVECFFMPDNADRFDFRKYDYVVDAIDTVTGKLALIEKACREETPVISSMGTGNKLDPSMFRITVIEKTRACPLAKVMRRELRDRGIQGVKVLYSEEAPLKPVTPDAQMEVTPDTGVHRRQTPGSVSFVPSVAGLMMAGEVVRDLLNMNEHELDPK